MLRKIKELFSFKAVAAGTAFRVAITSIADVDLSQRTIIAGAVVLTLGYTATDTSVYFAIVFMHHNKSSLKVQTVWANSQKLLTFLKISCTI